ncbi:hypothetical protein ACFL6O_00105 [candidate division KSB1 bacterium]
MNNHFKVFAILLIIVSLTIGGCTTDMDIRNDNNPDTKRVLVTPADVENLIASSFRLYHFAQHGHDPGRALTVMGDEMSSSWGNNGMRDMSEEPAKAINNSSSYGSRRFIEDPWYDNYEVISNVNDGINAIIGGLEMGEDGSTDTDRAHAFAKMCQGLAQGYIGILFDKGFIFPEGIELSSYSPEFAESGLVTAAGIASLQEAITLASADFTTPGDWINGVELTNEELQQVCHSYIARYMVLDARTAAERAALDWTTIVSHINSGITEDFGFEGDDNSWWHPVQYQSNWNGWHTVDNHLHGPSDTSGNYQAWLATPSASQMDFINFSSDRRVTGDDTGITDGEYFYYNPTMFHYASRGTYHWSRYRWQRYDYQYPSAYGFHPMLYTEELDMLKAEAYLRGYGGGSKADVAALINTTRVGTGQMPALDGTESDLELWRAMCYEKRMETTLTGIAWYDYRAWAGLTMDGETVIHVPTGRALEFPVPAKELELLLLDTYTFGGVGNPNTTPGIKAGSRVIDMEYIQKAKAYIDRHNKSNEIVEVKK